MFKPRFLMMLLTVGLVVANARAQNQPAAPPSDEQQLMQQQMQRIQQILQKMQEKGMDPQQFFQQMAQQMQDGTLDRASLEKQLIDKGIVDQQTLDDMQNSTKTMAMLNIKRQLDVSDEDWTALQPAIQRVMNAMAAAGQSGPAGGMGGFMGGGASAPDDLAKSRRDLGAAIKDPNTSSDDFAAKMQALRDSRAKAEAELASARKDLTSLVTVRQESALALLGIL
jgi:hypothetical protein